MGNSGPREDFGVRRTGDAFDAKADAEAVLSAIGAPDKLMVLRGAKSWWHPGRSGKLSLGPKNIMCAFGELHPKIVDAFNVKGPAVAFAIHLQNPPLPKKKSTTRSALKTSDFQAVDRDFAFVVDNKVEALSILNAAKGADKSLISDAFVFDVFNGDKAEGQMGLDKKSVAITVKLQPISATLTDKDIESVSEKIIEKVTKATGGVLRG